MLRTFIAFDLDENTRNEFLELTYKCKSVYPKEMNWVDPANLHFTYFFLGDIVPSDKKTVINLVADLTNNLPVLHLEKGELKWDSLSKPHCLWIEYLISSACNTDFHNVRKKFIYDIKQAIPYLELDKRDFKCHLTLGRVKKKESKTIDISKWALAEEIFEKEITLSQISVYQSILYPQGPVYKPLAIFNLKGE